MKGLIIKDFKMMRHESPISYVIPIFFFIFSLLNEHSEYFAYFSIMMFALLPTLNIANDEKYKWDKYEAILPIKKEHIVLEKYVILIAFIVPITTAEAIIIQLIKDYTTYETLNMILIMLFFGLISPSVVLPLYFIFGYNTGRMAGVPLTAVIYICFLTIGVNRTTNNIASREFLKNTNALLFILTGLTIILASIIISIIVYKRKEF